MGMQSDRFDLVPVIVGEIEGVCIACGKSYRHNGLLLELRQDFGTEGYEALGRVCPWCLRRGEDHVKDIILERAERLREVARAFERLGNWPDGCGLETYDDLPF